MASNIRDSVSDLHDSDIWLGSWFTQRHHLLEYMCIHGALLPVSANGVKKDDKHLILNARWFTNPAETLQIIKAEPFGISSALLIDSTQYAAWSKYILSLCVNSTMPQNVQVFCDDQGICCLCVGGSSLLWLIHKSKLVLNAPKSKRRGLSDAQRRSKSVVGIAVLSLTIAKQCAATIPALALIGDSAFLEACLKCWLYARYTEFAKLVSRSIKSHASQLGRLFATRLGGHSELIAACLRLQEICTLGYKRTAIPVDIIWFLSRFDVCRAMIGVDASLATIQNLVLHLSIVTALDRPVSIE